MSEAIVLGDINVDVLMPISTYPRPGGDALSGQMTTQAGGSAANTAIALAKLGVAASMVGRLGEDVWGSLALRALTDSGVEVSAVQHDEAASTGLFFIPITPDGERTMFGHRGANVNTEPSAINPTIFKGARFLHLSGYALLEPPQREAALQAIELAGQHGLALSLDTGLLPALARTDEIGQLLPRLSICVLGVEEARALAVGDSPADLARALVARGVKLVGLKLGAEGCLLADSSGLFNVPSFSVKAVDTTGAGDAFSAGLIYGQLRGLSLPAAGTLANTLGSLAAATWGAGPALPGREAVRKRLAAEAATAEDERTRWIEEVLAKV
ncbi:MAG: carbohydrate kinase family protein [Chloroflexi bacterium]|nr:carbohydrate kinase family protein [Chloroflexota bacterium]